MSQRSIINNVPNSTNNALNSTRTKKILALLCVAGLAVAQQTSQQPASQKPPQQTPQTDTTQPPNFAVSTTRILVPVSVMEKNNDPVNGLTPYDFDLFDNGRPQVIAEDITSHPISLVLVIQASSSVDHFLPQIQRLGNLVQSQLLGDTGEVALIAFDHRIQTLLPFTADTDKLSAAMKKIHAGSSQSAVNDAIMAAINMLRIQDPHRRRIVVVVAQNKNGGSETPVREVVTAADFNQVTIFPIDMSKMVSDLTETPMYNRPNPIPPEGRPVGPGGTIQTPTTDSQTDMGNWVPAITQIFDLAKSVFVPNPLTVYARYTGGHSYSFMNQKDLERAVNRISDFLHSEYMLTYSPSDINEPGFHQIKVDVKARDLKVTARDGYYWAGFKK